MRAIKLISILFIAFNIKSLAQPTICSGTPAMTSFCSDACIICDIDGFTGINNSTTTGQAPPDFCTSFVHHMQWIGFVAGTTNVSIEITVFNCRQNEGLEVGLYESFDCLNFRKVSECDTDIRENESRVFTNTVPLTIGQYYYFVMDGSSGDVCNYSIKVLNGSTKVDPLDDAAFIDMPEKVCQFDSFEIKTPGISGATFYNWTLNGQTIHSGTTFQYAFANPGRYNICLNPSNVCDQAPQSCKNVEVIQGSRSSFSHQVCFGECYNFEGTDYCATGLYDIIYTAANGCDSIVTLDLLVDDRIETFASLFLCRGDTLFIGDTLFLTDGRHQAIIQTEENCNVYLTFDLTVLECDINVATTVTPVRCYQENSGSIVFSVTQGTPPFVYKGYKIENQSITFIGNITGLNNEIEIPGVDEGNYIFEITDLYGNIHIVNVFVSQPSNITIDQYVTDYNTYQVSCYGGSDGAFVVKPIGGVAPYTYVHVGQTSVSDSLFGLMAGTYETQITDAKGCIYTIQTELKQPDSLMFVLAADNPTCDGLGTGRIQINNAGGGIAPYSFAINGGVYAESMSFENLIEGDYTITIKDKNECTTVQKVSILAPEIPIITLNEEDVTLRLGDSILLEVVSNLDEQVVDWTPDVSLSCDDCLITYARPFDNTSYIVTVTSKDGCTTTARVNIDIDKQRSFVISNVITDNGDNINDKMRYFADTDVASLVTFQVYDRWGNLIYRLDSSESGLVDILWDGTYKGSKVASGIYTWLAQVEYIDSEVIGYSGSITVLR
ncbi:MAG TPA: gliding motility-associated C-terminal domain-containing protein [Saprospiraceae bacterium]|nr:gliding motility-associated C-terminal domain-containing protein [Saprospiraceae bacterium]